MGLKEWGKELGKICWRLKPTGCLECISGSTTGTMLEFMGYNSTLILYGLLSEKPVSNIQTINFIGKNQTIESFLLTNYLAELSLMEYIELIMRTEPMYSSELKTTI